MLETANRRDFEDLSKQLDRVMDQLLHRHYPPLRTTNTWAPAINAYRLPDRLEVCVELAGVERGSIEVSVDAGRLTIRGVRQTPRPPGEGVGEAGGPAHIHILAMEIDDGAFERTVSLPREVDVRRVSAEQINGLLWVRLPLK